MLSQSSFSLREFVDLAGRQPSLPLFRFRAFKSDDQCPLELQDQLVAFGAEVGRWFRRRMGIVVDQRPAVRAGVGRGLLFQFDFEIVPNLSVLLLPQDLIYRGQQLLQIKWLSERGLSPERFHYFQHIDGGARNGDNGHLTWKGTKRAN